MAAALAQDVRVRRSFWDLTRQFKHPKSVPAEIAPPVLPVDPEQARLDALNSCLAALAAVFPDVSANVLREMLGSFPEESRLQVIVEALLRNKDKWVQGRWRLWIRLFSATPEAQAAQPGATGLQANDHFRSLAYKDSVKTLLCSEFRGLSQSTIFAILAEHNYSYMNTRQALFEAASRSWRYSFATLFSRKKTVKLEDCPVLLWRRNSTGDAEPTLVSTSCPELDKELFDAYIAPWQAARVHAQVWQDFAFAHQVNDDQAAELRAEYECECCYSAVSFERLACCAAGEHFLCFDCVRRVVDEALFGQGWKSIDQARWTVRCFATGECRSSISRAALQVALHQDPESAKVWDVFEDRAARENVAASRAAPLACPFCPYAEALEAPAKRWNLSISRRTALIIATAVTLLVSLLLPAASLALPWLIMALARTKWQPPRKPLVYVEPNHGTKFICRNPSCSRTSCLRCKAPWLDTHLCHVSARQAFAAFVDAAVTAAVTRTCPRCNLSFVKASGCNKLVCTCGYCMCYVCRQDIGRDGYAHFCPHFREVPGEACRQCSKCDLYKTDDDELVILRARTAAVAEWKARAGEHGVQELDELAR